MSETFFYFIFFPQTGSSAVGLLGISWHSLNFVDQRDLNDSGMLLEEDESQVIIIFESEEDFIEADDLLNDARCDLDFYSIVQGS
jgi:hypothetical protein